MCLNKDTGKPMWTWRLDKNYSIVLGDMLIESGKIFLKTDNEAMFCIDAETGKEVWRNINMGGGVCFNPIYHNGVIYMSSWSEAVIYGINATTGKITWNFKPITKKTLRARQFTNPIGIDKERNLLFAFDGYDMFCFQLPK
jgi:outer membrane protein assembly factor BamB